MITPAILHGTSASRLATVGRLFFTIKADLLRANPNASHQKAMLEIARKAGI